MGKALHPASDSLAPWPILDGPFPPRPTVRLVLGDQLNSLHSWFRSCRDDVIYVLMEVRQETDYVLHHAQKILGFFAAMRAFAQDLRETGHRVLYLRIDDPHNRQGLCENLEALLSSVRAVAFEYQAPDEYRLDRQLAELATRLSIPAEKVDSEHFYTTRTGASEIFGERRQWLMETFYRRLRERHHILLQDSGKPVGDQWNFDELNRKPWKGSPPEPTRSRPTHDLSELWSLIQSQGIPSFGESTANAFRWPLNRREALEDLAIFLEHSLPHFGDFQDAMTVGNWRLFHSLLSFALNTKMLSPREVIQGAVEAWEASRAPLHAVEGFVRQILGWREYVRGVYWAHMPGYDQLNFFEHHLPLPRWFWTGQTHLRCLQQSIGQSLQRAYAHHIQRLMVIGNFALLAGLDPSAVHQWYLGVYIDAVEWVELPNTLGMSQYADGGKLASKPYVSSAAYLKRMSNYCSSCRYRSDERLGENACPFNALYWDFFERHAPKLSKNHRLGMVYRQLQGMSAETKQAIHTRADQIRNSLDRL
jgi:deoxyribodipyrimidine photolyase-related protein